MPISKSLKSLKQLLLNTVERHKDIKTKFAYINAYNFSGTFSKTFSTNFEISIKLCFSVTHIEVLSHKNVVVILALFAN
jgi:hypothetical protein